MTLLRPSEAAEMLGVCERTLRDLRKDGLKYVTGPRGAIAYRQRDLNEFIADRTVQIVRGRPTYPHRQDRSTPRKGIVCFTDLPAFKAADKKAIEKHFARQATRYIRLSVVRAVYERDGRRCVYCGTTSGEMHLDHVQPWSRGGQSTAENLAVACASCNLSKADRTPDEWKCSK